MLTEIKKRRQGLLFTKASETETILRSMCRSTSTFFVFSFSIQSVMSSEATLAKLPSNRLPMFGILTVGALTLDLWSKTWAFEKFGLTNGSEWMINQSWIRFRWFTSLNPGALWGMGQGFALGFAALSVVAFAGIIYWLFVKKAAISLWLTVSMAFVAGGTLGNLYDRLGLHGVIRPTEKEPAQAVRDFFHFQFGSFDWAIFNVADVCLVTGAIMLMLHSLTAKEETEVKAEPAATA